MPLSDHERPERSRPERRRPERSRPERSRPERDHLESDRPHDDATREHDRLPPEDPWAPRKFPHLPPLSSTARILLLILGWVLIALGLLGLLLPGLQGIATLALGAAALSLVSRTSLNVLRWTLRPWPRAWRFVLRIRRRVLLWFSTRKRPKP